MPNLDSPQLTAVVTGSTGAIGKAIAAGIAQKGIKVIQINRNHKKSQETTAELINLTGNQQIEFIICDLSREKEIADLADRWAGPLHILVNNAAVTPPSREETPEGIELQFATNVLGYFWMSLAFKDILANSKPSRIVNVASYWAGGLDVTDLEFKKRNYQNGAAYRQSKQANRMLSVVFANLFKPSGITVNACHPGDVNSTLSNNLGFGGSQSPEHGAETPVWLATSPEVAQVSGKYFEHLQMRDCEFSQDQNQAQLLYEACAAYTNFIK